MAAEDASAVKPKKLPAAKPSCAGGAGTATRTVGLLGAPHLTAVEADSTAILRTAIRQAERNVRNRRLTQGRICTLG